MRQYQDFNGKILSASDDGTPAFKGSGLEITNGFGTMKSFDLGPNSVNTVFGLWFNTTKFNQEFNSIGRFDKFYDLNQSETSQFLTTHSEIIDQFLQVMRELCGATETATFKHCSIDPIGKKINVAFYENGILFTYFRDDIAFDEGWNGEFFANFKTAMYQLAWGIALDKDPDLWATAIDAE